MPEAIISTECVQATLEGNAVEVVATLDVGEILPGMFLHIPLNSLLDFTVRIIEIAPLGGNHIRLVLDCGDDPDATDLVLAFNFADETLWVLETGNE
jgi:hypothetical protein